MGYRNIYILNDTTIKIGETERGSRIVKSTSGTVRAYALKGMKEPLPV